MSTTWGARPTDSRVRLLGLLTAAVPVAAALAGAALVTNVPVAAPGHSVVVVAGGDPCQGQFHTTVRPLKLPNCAGD